MCGNGYIFSDPGDSRKSLSGSKCVRTCVGDDGRGVWIASAGTGAVCDVYEASVLWRSGIFVSKPFGICCRDHKTILACDSQDWNSGDLTGSCPGNRIWDFQTFARHSVTRAGVFTGNLLLGGIPNFVVALLLLLIFGVWLKWLPVSGLDSWKHYILPVCALALYPACALARLTGSLLLQEQKKEYVLFAKTKGLKNRQILLEHMLPHIWIPVLNYLGAASAFLLTGSFVTESIFTIPGLGRQFVNSIANRDYTLILGLTVFMGTVVILIQLAVDLLCAVLDPRVRKNYTNEEKPEQRRSK